MPQVVIDEQRPAQVCREHGLAEALPLRWHREDADRGEAAFSPSVATSTEGVEHRIAEVERFCGQLAVENGPLTKGMHARPSRSGTR